MAGSLIGMRRFNLANMPTSVIDEITAMRIRQYEDLTGTEV